MVRGPADTGERQIDWDYSLRFFERTLNRLVGRKDELLVCSLASDAALRLVRVARRVKISNPDAMMTTIAYRVYQDWKRKVVHRPAMVSIDSPGQNIEFENVPDPRPIQTSIDAELATIEWVTFKALEMIDRVAGADCRDYLKAYYLERWDHGDIAEALGISIPAARKRKSRCEATLKRWVEEHPNHSMTRELRRFLERYEE
jgi:DNA-directed RNA polymerase specialized sigma24 family protein